MTPEQKAELRCLLPSLVATHNIPPWVANAIPELLDELEATQALCPLDLGSVLGAQLAHERRANDAEARAASLAAQVARLRGTLEITHLDAPGKCPGAKCPVVKALADTEAAATTWLEADRREQRSLGAQAFFDWLRLVTAGRWELEDGVEGH